MKGKPPKGALLDRDIPQRTVNGIEDMGMGHWRLIPDQKVGTL